MSTTGHLGAARGAALYVGALIGPGVLLVPALAAEAAGPAAIVAWVALLLLSLPLAITFATLGTRHPVPGGVTAYVAERFGGTAAACTGTVFLVGVVFGTPAVALIGGYYVADLTGGGTAVAVPVGLAMFALVLGANTLGLRVSSGAQLVLSGVLVGIVVLAVATALPGNATDGWTPFAPEGWWAVGTAASLLMWLFFGWEAMAQYAGDFRDPGRDLPRAMAIAYGVIALLYVGLGVASITVASTSNVPLADLLEVGLGAFGRDATAVVAVALTMGTMNVYVGGAAKLAAALSADGALPAWLASGPVRDSVPLRPLAVLGALGAALLGLLALDLFEPEALVRSTSACFVAVYLLALASAVGILAGRARVIAAIALASIAVVTVFSGPFLLVPLVVGTATLAIRPRRRPAATCELAT